MIALRIYVLGGLLLCLYHLGAVWHAAWQMRESEEAASLPVWTAGLLASPTALALATVAILLGLLQPYVKLRGGLRVGMAVLFLAGAIIFPCAVYYDVASQGWSGIGVFSFLGLLLLGSSLMVNLVGLLRFRIVEKGLKAEKAEL